MASWCTILFVLYITVRNAESSFVEVKCSAKNVGYYGQQSLLECVVQTSSDVTDAKIRVVTWKRNKDDNPLLAFVDGTFIREPGYGFAEPEWNENKMNISMLITKTTVAHDGDYICDVITNKGLGKMDTRLEVQAKYSLPSVTSKPEKILPNSHSSLICQTHGGYPKGQLRWFDNSKGEWTKSAEMKVEQTDGLFRLTSILPLMPGSTFPQYTCILYNASGEKEHETTFETPLARDGPDSQSPESVQVSKILAPVLVIGSLIVGLLMALLFYRRRSQMARRPSAAPLMGFAAVPPHDAVGVEDCHCAEMVKEPKDMV